LAGNDYRLRIESLTDPNIFDFGEFFTIAIAVTSPTQNAMLDIYDIDVNWITANVTGNVRLELYKNGAPFNILQDNVIVDNTANDGIQNISFDPANIPEGFGYSIKVVSVTDPSVFGFSRVFSIQIPTITWFYPGGTGNSPPNIFSPGDQVLGSWSSDVLIENVNIDLYKDNILIASIEENLLNDGQELLTFPTTLVEGTDYQLRIESSSNPNIFDFGDEFEIVFRPTVTVTSPMSGDVFSLGSQLTVEWLSENVPENVKIELFKVTAFVATLISTTANDGSETVTIPASGIPEGSDYGIKVTGFGNEIFGAASGFSEFFTITESCPDDLTITTQSTNSNAEAEHTIESALPIDNNNTVVYHAGEEVLLTDGFMAGDGTTFRAYIEGCSGNFQSIQGTTDTEKKTE